MALRSKATAATRKQEEACREKKAESWNKKEEEEKGGANELYSASWTDVHIKLHV